MTVPHFQDEESEAQLHWGAPHLDPDNESMQAQGERPKATSSCILIWGGSMDSLVPYGCPFGTPGFGWSQATILLYFFIKEFRKS